MELLSLGCAMFYLMTGKFAFPGDSPIDRLGRRISTRPVPITDYLPNLPASAARVLERLLAPKPQDRFDSAREAADALQSVIRPRTRSASSSRPAPASAVRADAAEGRLPTTGEESSPRSSASASAIAPTSASAPVYEPPPASALASAPASAPAVAPQLMAATAPVPALAPYPAWFRPLAASAEQAPRRLLVGLVTTLILVFGAGVGLGYFLR